MSTHPHLRLAGKPGSAPRCRTTGCALRSNGELGYCSACEAVYHAARELREQLLARRGAQLHAAHRAMFDALSPAVRNRLLAHMAARTAQQGQPAHVFDEFGLEDFLAELNDLGLTALT